MSAVDACDGCFEVPALQRSVARINLSAKRMNLKEKQLGGATSTYNTYLSSPVQRQARDV